MPVLFRAGGVRLPDAERGAGADLLVGLLPPKAREVGPRSRAFQAASEGVSMSEARVKHMRRYLLEIDGEPCIIIYANNIRAAREEAEVIGYRACVAIQELPR